MLTDLSFEEVVLVGTLWLTMAIPTVTFIYAAYRNAQDEEPDNGFGGE